MYPASEKRFKEPPPHWSGQLSPNIDPWEKQPGEGSCSYKGLTIYRDIGPSRSIRKATVLYWQWRNPDCELAHADPSTLHPNRCNMMASWSSKFLWTIRIMAWEKLLEQQRIELQIEAHREMNKRHIEYAQSLQSVAADSLSLIRDAVDNGRGLSPEDVRRMFVDSVKMEREASGLPSKSTEVQLSGPGGAAGAGMTEAQIAASRQPDLSKITPEENLTMAKILRKVLGKPEPDAIPAKTDG